MEIITAKNSLKVLVDKYVVDNSKSDIIKLIDSHASVPIRGVFDEIVKNELLSEKDRILLDDIMHYFG